MKKRSIAQIIIQPLFILICIALSACIILYITQINRIDSYVNGDLNKRIVYAASIFGDMQSHLEVVSAELRSSRSDDLRVAIAKDDVDKIDEEVTQVVQLCNLDGYVVVDLDGNIKTSSYSKVAETEINTIALTVKNSGKEIGFGTFIDGKICEYLAQTFYSEEGDATSVVFLVGQIVSKYETLEALKSKVGLDIYVMDNKQCLATSDTTVSIANVHLLQEAIDSCLIGKTIWSGNATFLGEQTHMSCMPFYDIFGNVIGVGMMRYRETITTEVRSALKIFAIVFVLVVVFTCFMMSWSVRYRIAIPIDVLIEKISQLAKGDLTVHIEPFNTSNEIDKLTNDLNIMKRKINDVLQPVVETTNIINQTVSDVTKVSNSISDSANSQAASLQEISSSMEEMGANIQQNTDNAIQTNKLSEEVNGQIDALQTSSSKSYEAIRSIANNIEGINGYVGKTTQILPSLNTVEHFEHQDAKQYIFGSVSIQILIDDILD